ncbi:MAG: hypothetical protein GY855_01270, partial [candidate division Zixibacteria bacterium]|nr:hypothetical protein [candidate division Zixibacteria bacterium]
MSNVAFSQGLSIQAQNKFEYYLNREADSLGVHSDSLRNRLVVDLLYENFYGGIWYEAFHPIGTPFGSSTDSSYSGISQRYFGWTDGNAEIRVGNYYANFNRGLILRAFESEDIQVDKNIDGVWTSYSGDMYNFEALHGRISLSDNSAITPLIKHRRNTLTGARGELTPFRQFRIGGGAVRYREKDPFFGEISYTNAWEVVTGANFGPLDFYANYCQQNGTEGYRLARFDLEEGDGTYLSGSFSTSLIGIAAEYKNYYNMALDFNSPPSANHRNQAPNIQGSGTNDRGFQISLFLSPFENWSFEADIAQSQERPDPVTGHSHEIIYNNFYEARGYIGRHIVIVNYERTEMGFEGLEHLPYGELTVYLNDDNTVTATGQVKKYEKMRMPRGKDDFNEIDYSISFSHSYFLTLTAMGGFTS